MHLVGYLHEYSGMRYFALEIKLISIVFTTYISFYEFPYQDLHAMLSSVSEIRLKSTQGRLYISYGPKWNSV
jgi:hypothetical protein